MTAQATDVKTRASRCAVCKIDRKGRFVFLDAQTEKLLGLTQVELFGRPLTDFLDPDDHDVISQITGRFNHYETFFDATKVTVIDSHGSRIPVVAVCSLNFDAGSPVNIQIILSRDDRLQPEPSESHEVPSSFSLASTFSSVDLLGRTNIGAVLIGADGTIIDRNDACEALLGGLAVGTDGQHLAEQLAMVDPAVGPMVTTYLEICDRNSDPPPLCLSVGTPTGRNAAVTLVRLAPGSEDQSALLVVQDTGVVGQTGINERFLVAALDQVLSALKAGCSAGEKLEHECHEELSRDGGFYLQCLGKHLDKSVGMLTDLRQLIGLDDKAEQPTLVDPGLLCEQSVRESMAANPHISLVVKNGNLPKVNACREKLTFIIKSVITVAARAADGQSLKCSLSGGVESDRYRLEMCFQGDGASSEKFHQAFDYAHDGTPHVLPALSGHFSDLALARELALAMGGDLRATVTGGSPQVIINMTFPVMSGKRGEL